MFFIEHNNVKLLFSKWLNVTEAVSFDATRKIRKGYEKRRKSQTGQSGRPVRVYKPGTWGIEIEIYVPSEIDEDELNRLLSINVNVQNDFYKSDDIPINPDKWEKENPRPNYEWSDDPVSNWSAVDGFKKPVGDRSTFPIEETLSRLDADDANTTQKVWDYVDKLLYWWTSGIQKDITDSRDWEIFKDNEIEELKSAADYKDIPNYSRFIRYYEYLSRPNAGGIWGDKAKEIHTSDPNISEMEFFRRLGEIYGSPSQWEVEDAGTTMSTVKGPNGDKIMTGPKQVIYSLKVAVTFALDPTAQAMPEENISYIKSLVEKLFSWHENAMKSLTKEEFDKIIEDKLDDWDDRLEELQDEYEDWDHDYEFEQFIRNISPEEAEEIYDIEIPYNHEYYMDEKVYHYIRFINGTIGDADYGNSTANTWGVGPDGTGIVEIRSPICTTKDFPALLKLLDELRQEEFNGDTSAHVHIGMPKHADAFDLIAMTTLVDEKAVVRDAGYERNFDDWARMNLDAHVILARWFMENPREGGIYTNKDGMAAIQEIARYQGTNLQSYFKLGTVEFRYLSSQIVANPELLIRWIQYYLMLPQIAMSRKQLRINYDGDEMIITRQPGGNFRVDFDTKSVKQPPESPQQLRGTQPTAWHIRMEKYLMRKYGDKSIKDVPILNNTSYAKSNETLKELWPELPHVEKVRLINAISSMTGLPKGKL